MTDQSVPETGLDDFDSDAVPSSQQLVVALDGFEGPLDLLLALARTQRLDLTKISILALAEQYLHFIDQVRALRLEIAADYLVMAAWLAYLKSKLLLPDAGDEDEGPSGEELALHLAFRLKRLEAMRDVIARIMTRKQLGVDFFARGMPEGIRTIRASKYWANVYDLLKSYAEQRQRSAVRTVTMGGRNVWSIKEARDRLVRLVGMAGDWAPLNALLAEHLAGPEQARTVTASSFGAVLELSREGYLDIRQERHFGPLYLRWRDGAGSAEDEPEQKVANG